MSRGRNGERDGDREKKMRGDQSGKKPMKGESAGDRRKPIKKGRRDNEKVFPSKIEVGWERGRRPVDRTCRCQGRVHDVR